MHLKRDTTLARFTLGANLGSQIVLEVSLDGDGRPLAVTPINGILVGDRAIEPEALERIGNFCRELRLAATGSSRDARPCCPHHGYYGKRTYDDCQRCEDEEKAEEAAQEAKEKAEEAAAELAEVARDILRPRPVPDPEPLS
jgi:hypothetical protein